jgi:hypothetical protein
MRLRRASAIALLSLLASAATASASCGWVLWNEMQRDGWEKDKPDTYSVGWVIIGGTDTYGDCTRRLVEKLADWKKDKSLKVDGNIAHESFHVEGQRGWHRSMRLICLPSDAPDPRGPKGN